jgi:hypothetical protein
MYLISADSGGTEMATTTMVHVRVDEAVKAQAAATLADMGLSVSDGVERAVVSPAAI